MAKKLRKEFDSFKDIEKNWECSDCFFKGTLTEIRKHKCKKSALDFPFCMVEREK